jgi:eukaryotic-like serine/threonine-protein kinase
MSIQLEGQLISRYRLTQLLGKGGMGTVYQAEDETLNRQVAIKIIHPSLMNQPQFHARFLQEAQMMANLDHPSVIRIYDFNSQDEWLYMVMELMSAGSLSAYEANWADKKKAVPLNEALHLIAQVAEALAYAHQRGIIHRDIKPDNVLLKKLDQPEKPGQPALRAVVTDFGLAKLQNENVLQTEPSLLLGTLPYVSPEQLEGKMVDGRSDIYSLGIVLYKVVTGRLPFDVRTPAEAIKQHRHGQPQPAGLIRPDVSIAVEAIINKALAKDPRSRYQTGTEMAAALRQAADQLSNRSHQTQIAPLPDAAAIPAVAAPPISEPPPSAPPPAPPQPADQLIIIGEDERTRRQSLQQDSFTIGRTPANDIVLFEDSVSSRHARLQRSDNGWQVVDLQSTNGTFLGNKELAPHVPHPWPPGEKLSIGPFTLLWQTAVFTPTDAPPAHEPARPVFIQAPEPVVEEQPALPSIAELTHLGSIRLEPMAVSLKPGTQTTVQAHMYNESSRVDHFTVFVEGLPAAWVKITEPTVQLMPNKETTFRFLLQPPEQTALAKTYPYRLILRSVSDGRIEGHAFGNVTVEPAPRFTVTLKPPKIKNQGNCWVSVRNNGNEAESFTIMAQEDEEAVDFDQMVQRVSVEAGREERVSFRLKPVKRPLTGNAKKAHPFRFRVSSAAGESNAQSGQLEVSPRFPGWIIRLLMVLFFGSATLTAVLASCTRTAISNEWRTTATAIAEEILHATQTPEASVTAGAIAEQTAEAVTRAADIAAFQTASAADATAAADIQATARADIATLQSAPPPPLPNPAILLDNPSFEMGFNDAEIDGALKQEIKIPVGWRLLVDDERSPVDNDPGRSYAFPEMNPQTEDRMNECNQEEKEPICEIFDQNQVLHVFKSGRAMRFALYQTTSILAPGTYRFSVDYFADVVQWRDENDRKVWGGPEMAEIHLCVEDGHYLLAETWQPVAQVGQVGSRELVFVLPQATTVTVYAKFRNTADNVGGVNGWFLDNFVLEQLSPEAETEWGAVSSCVDDMRSAYAS